MTRQPLSVDERDRVLRIQQRIGALKECERCKRWLPVDLFRCYGFQPCDPCCRELAFDHQRAGSLARWRPTT